MTNDHKKEINRNKQTRLREILNMAARRMGHKSWSTLGSNLRARFIPFEESGTEAAVNAVIMGMLADLFSAVKAGKDIPDKELKRIANNNPRLRKNWRKQK